MPRPCPRAAAPLRALKAGAGRVRLTLGTRSSAAAVNGHLRLPLQSAELACQTAAPQRDGSGVLTPEHRGGLHPTRQTRCLLIPSPLPAGRGCRGCVLEGSVRLITQRGSGLGYPPWEGRISGVPCRGPRMAGRPRASAHQRHPPPPGTDPRHAPTGAALGKTPRCQCLLLYFPKFLDSCFLIPSGRGKKCHTNSSIGSYILLLDNMTVLYSIYSSLSLSSSIVPIQSSSLSLSLYNHSISSYIYRILYSSSEGSYV